MLTAVQTPIYPLLNTIEINGPPTVLSAPLFLAILGVLHAPNVCVLEQTSESRPSSLTWLALSGTPQGIIRLQYSGDSEGILRGWSVFLRFSGEIARI